MGAESFASTRLNIRAITCFVGKFMGLRTRLSTTLGGLLRVPEEGTSPERYRVFHQNIVILMLAITLLPLSLTAFINYHQYQTALKSEILSPLRGLVRNTKHSLELSLTKRLSAVRFVASAYSYEDLADDTNLNRIFRLLKQEFQGFVDLGLIDDSGLQVSYAGPYGLEGKNYAEQDWFQQLRVSEVYISDVFMGYRKFPHFVIAVRHVVNSKRAWILRATFDTGRFDELIASMGLDPRSDAFLINRNGVLQTNSKFYGKILDTCPITVPPLSYEPNTVELKDPEGRNVLLAYAYLGRPDFIVMVVKPWREVLSTWYTLKTELLVLFVVSVVAIILVVFKLTSVLINRMQEADAKRELAFREIEHSHKLSSIGRLAAGVAHEINNPMAIINEKAGLMKDLLEYAQDFPDKDRFLAHANAITRAVDRCRVITHRLLGFARRMDVEIEILDVNDVVKEVLGFLEKEAALRSIKIKLHLADNLPRIASDRGQLQQIFLNILNNAFAAVQDGGNVSVGTWEKDGDTVEVTFQDDGHGMSEETLQHIFEPFFTTKKGYGTGLGLSITYGIIKKLGGDIDVQSRPGVGTRFTVFLPKQRRQ